LTQEQLEQINEALQQGETLEGLARRMGLSRSGLNFQLLQSGKRVVTYRRLEDTAPVDEPRELAAA